MKDKQKFITDYWLKKSQGIDKDVDTFDLVSHIYGKEKHQVEINAIESMGLIHSNSIVLDFGCGNGRLCKNFHNKVKHFVGIDLCKNFIDELNIWKNKNNISNVDFVVLDALDENFQNNIDLGFSLVCIFGVFQYIVNDSDVVKILRQINNLMLPQATCLIKQTTSIINKNLFIDKYSEMLQSHYIANYRSKENMTNLLEIVGFEITLINEAYNLDLLGEKYREVEPWDETRQYYFKISKK